MEILNKVLTLNLNSNWQPIGYKTVQTAICHIFTPNYCALDISYDKKSDGGWDLESMVNMIPVDWDDWIKLPIRDFDFFVRSAFLKIRVPTIIISKQFNKMPKIRSKLSKRNIRARDKGVCQYTGEKLQPSEGNVDHIIPLSKGGANTWTNMVYCNQKLNEKKGDKLPEEAGLSLIKEPKEPISISAMSTIKNIRHPDWSHFIS